MSAPIDTDEPQWNPPYLFLVLLAIIVIAILFRALK